MKLKPIVLLLLAALMITSVLGCSKDGANGSSSAPTESEGTTSAPIETSTEPAAEKAAYTPGTYESTMRGHNGNLTVAVTFSEDAITDVTVESHAESVGIGTWPIASIPKAIVEKQSLAIDTVTGATITSVTLLNAAKDCVLQANGDADKLLQKEETEPATKEPIELTTDVLVIGGGGTGLAASIEAARGGAQVIIIEKLDYLGGDTGRAGGGIEAAGTSFQEARGIYDNPEDFAAFIRSRGITYHNPALLDIMTGQSAAAVDFLAELGSDMSMQVAGHGAPVERAHRPAEGPAGQNIVQPMIAALDDLSVEVYYGTPGYELIEEDGAVVGAKAHNTRSGQEYIIHAASTVIATGNFASNNEMVAQYDSRLKGIGTNSSTGSQGDGIVMATAVGADLENMEVMRVRPTLPTKVNNYIAVSQDGVRFMDEYNSHDTIFVEGHDLHIKAVEDKEEKYYWLLIDEASYLEQTKDLSVYMAPGNFYTADTLDELAEKTGLDAKTLKDTVETWNTMVENGEDTLFGRTKGMDAPIGDGPYYAAKVMPTAHTTAGGIRINENAEVLDVNENPIPGLFAGGEVTGGVHDGVSAVTGAIVFGRISGISAAAYAAK